MADKCKLPFIALLWAAGCRPDAGVPDYTGHVGLRDKTAFSDEILDGTNPYDPMVPRLYLGAFYEGDRSDEIVVNDVDTHYYIFQIEGTQALTYTQDTSPERVEGQVSDAIILEGTPWWGGGLIWDRARDLSRWTTLYISLRSSFDAFDDVEITVQSETPAGVLEAFTLPATGYGYTNDGAWHGLRIPLADFSGFDASRARSPLILGRGVVGDPGDVLLVDDFYYEAE